MPLVFRWFKSNSKHERHGDNMLTRFRTNVAMYPRLFKLTLALSVLTAAYYLLPIVWVFRAELVLAATGAFVIYMWITLDAGRTQTMLDILNLFEGREVCTITEHVVEEEDEDDSIYTEEEKAEEADEEELG
jgi:hypothetical protein